jgi:hypothetical protein
MTLSLALTRLSSVDSLVTSMSLRFLAQEVNKASNNPSQLLSESLEHDYYAIVRARLSLAFF